MGLYVIVFGESVLNDAVSVIMNRYSSCSLSLSPDVSVSLSSLLYTHASL